MTKKSGELRLQFQRFAAALLAIALATALILFVPSLRTGGMYFLFLTATVFSAFYGGVRASAFAAVLSVVICFAFAAFNRESQIEMSSWLVLSAFAVASGLTVLLCHRQVESEAARKKAESRYRTIFEDAITGIYETTLDGRYVTANPKLAEIFGYESPAQMLGKTVDLNQSFYVEPGRRREFAQMVDRIENVQGFESEVRRRDGALIWISENAVAVRDKTRKIVGFQGTTIDITARKKAETELQRAHEELEAKVLTRTRELAEINEALLEVISERKNIEDALKVSEQHLRDLTAHLQRVREEERKSLARELHDELGQVLTALKLDLSWLLQKAQTLEPSALALQITGKLPQTLAIVDMAMDTTQKIVAELRPGVLDELGLAAAARWQVRELQKRTGIECELGIDFDENGLSQELATAMFRILQECLTNITRHSHASKARLAMTEENNRLRLRVEDNGRGISDAEISDERSFGILGMRERARLLGGELRINPAENGGTLVVIEIPR